MADYLHSNNPTAVFHVIDTLTDKGELPAYVAEANLPDITKLASISNTGFADPLNRQYPVYDQTTTAYSAMDFLGKAEGDVVVGQRIKKACANFGMSDFYTKVEDIFAEAVVKQAAAQEKPLVKYAFSMEDENGNTLGYFPLNNDFQVEESAKAFLSQKDSMPADIAISVAREIVKSAKEYGNLNYIHQDVITMGTPRIFEAGNAERQVRLRSNFVEADTLELYNDIVKSAAGADEEYLFELTSMWEELDETFLVKDAFAIEHRLQSAYDCLHAGAEDEVIEKYASTQVYFHEENVLIPAEAFTKVASKTIDHVFAGPNSGKVQEFFEATKNDAFEATALVNGLDADIRKDIVRVTLAANE
jgi:hypothetical protein